MAKVRVKTVNLGGIDTDDVADMFDSVLGTNKVDMGVAHEKYMKFRYSINRFFDVMKLFAAYIGPRGYADAAAEIDKFIMTTVGSPYHKYFGCAEMFETVMLPTTHTDICQSFADIYQALKESDFINQFVIVCDKLAAYKRFLIEPPKEVAKPREPFVPSGAFLRSMAGVTFAPFPFTNLNVKDLYVANAADNGFVTVVLKVLSKSFAITYELWNNLQTPDINIDQFVARMSHQMNDLIRIPELSRCRRAVSALQNSLNMLKNNFGEYYRDFVQTRSSSTIMENYIADVIKGVKADNELRRQFMLIIRYYRKAAAKQGSNPKSKEMFEKIDKTLAHFGRGTNNLGASFGPDIDEEDIEVGSNESAVSDEEISDEMMHRIANSTKSVEQLAAEIENLGRDKK